MADLPELIQRIETATITFENDTQKITNFKGNLINAVNNANVAKNSAEQDAIAANNAKIAAEQAAASVDVQEAPIDGKVYGRQDGAWTEVSGGSGSIVWGGITGTLSNQTDLQNALNLKANDNEISVVGKSGSYDDLLNKPTILPDAPANGQQYIRKDNAWSVLNIPPSGNDYKTENLVKNAYNFDFTSTSTTVWSNIKVGTYLFGNKAGLPTLQTWFVRIHKGFEVIYGETVNYYTLIAYAPNSNEVYVRQFNDGSGIPAINWKVLGGAASWGSISGTLSSQTDLQTALNGKANTSHTHTIANVTNLQAALDGKANTNHTHVIDNVTGLQTALDAKQNTLVSGTNIKTINGENLLGSGDIVIGGGGSSGCIQDLWYRADQNAFIVASITVGSATAISVDLTPAQVKLTQTNDVAVRVIISDMDTATGTDIVISLPRTGDLVAAGVTMVEGGIVRYDIVGGTTTANFSTKILQVRNKDQAITGLIAPTDFPVKTLVTPYTGLVPKGINLLVKYTFVNGAWRAQVVGSRYLFAAAAASWAAATVYSTF